MRSIFLLVFAVALATTLFAQTSVTSGSINSCVPSTTGNYDSLATRMIQGGSLHYNAAGSFFKTYCGWLGRVLVSASDGGYYMGGETPQGKVLAKFSATGKSLWARRFEYFSSDLYFYTLIEDSDGMLVGCATSFSDVALTEMMVFRYDPLTDQMLWVQQVSGPQSHVRGFEILEKSVGGDYLLVYRVGILTGNYYTEICTLDRITGTVPGGQVWRYGPLTSLTSADIHQGYLYASGVLRDTQYTIITSRGGVMKIDLNTGIPVWANVTKDPLLIGLIDGDMIVDNDGNLVSTISEGKLRVCFQKTTADGKLLWFKRFQFSNIPENRFNPMGITRLPDGYLCGIHASSDNVYTFAFIVVKTDTSGNVIWAKRVPNVGNKSYLSPQLLATRNNGGAFATNVLKQMSQQSRMVFGTFDENGNISDPCQIVEDCSVSLVDLGVVLDPAEFNFSTITRMFTKVTPNPSLPHGLLQNTACSSCMPCDSIAVQQIIEFYPGDTITLGGADYAQSDTVTLTLTTDDGCDSVVTYILRLVVTNVDFVCPPDQTVSIPAGQSSVSVSYPQPAAATDCPDPDLVLTRLQGPPSGGIFPEGTTLVCYEAANQCNIRDTCCFTVTAQKTADETACDVKIPPGSCIKYELLGIRLDALGRPRYRMRLTNTCASPLRFAYFQLPNGMTAKAPLEGATYTAPGGNTYLVRNPNAAPFHSIRFKPVSGTLNNGKSDIFEYTLPKQAQPAFILVSAKLEDGSSSEAHINTFSSPVQPYVASVQEPSVQERHAGTAASVAVRPNPTSGMLFVEITGGQNQSARIQVLNAQGQLVLEGEHSPGRALQLPAGLANGLYFLLVQPADGGARVATRFVLER